MTVKTKKAWFKNFSANNNLGKLLLGPDGGRVCSCFTPESQYIKIPVNTKIYWIIGKSFNDDLNDVVNFKDKI